MLKRKAWPRDWLLRVRLSRYLFPSISSDLFSCAGITGLPPVTPLTLSPDKQHLLFCLSPLFPSPHQGTSHLIPETATRIIKIVKEKLHERSAEGPAGFLKLFRDIDADHGGTIDRDEMRTFLNYYSLGKNDEVFEEIFNGFDPDGSGDIDMQEFLTHLLDRSMEEHGKEESGLLHDRQKGGTREFDTKVPKALGCTALDSSLDALDVINLIKEKIFSRTKSSSGTTTTAFRMFKRGERNITRKHFFEVLLSYNIKLNSIELQHDVWNHFDTDGDGTLDFDEFIEHIFDSE